MSFLPVAFPLVVAHAALTADTVVLNYALTLEHLENAFYHTALANYTQQDFVDAGLPSWSRGRFKELAEHEQSHVDVLKSVLGANATQPCTYDL